MIDNNKQILQILEIEQNFNKRFYSSNRFCYYSPFKTDSFDFYSYHVLALIGENISSIEECAIGHYIAPNEPYYLIENDIIIEFHKTKINGYQVKKKDNKLFLNKFCEDTDDNIFIANFVKLKLLTN